MKIGQKFNNGGMRLTCLDFFGDDKKNVGLFIRESDEMLITARDTSVDNNCSYSWAWGHYFTDIEEAKKDFQSRVADLKSYI